MAPHARFNVKSLAELKTKIAELKVGIELQDDLTPLARRVRIGDYETPNSLAVLPMEGCDGTEDGAPSELTFRRYRRFAAGGAGLLWFEATAVVPEGRANPRQLHINRHNLPAFKELLQDALQAAWNSMGSNHRPLCILQLTHSGRYSKPYGQQQPIIAYHDPYLDGPAGVTPDQAPITDAELEQLQASYVEAALLAREAGFDGVDIKSCHRYLLSELLAAHTRHGKYGGEFQNRVRFLLETIARVKAAVGDELILAVRLSACDAHPYPYGWGVDQEDYTLPDLTEPKQLLHLLKQQGVSLVAVSAGNPYYNRPDITRPFDTPMVGATIPPEHPLESVARLFSVTRDFARDLLTRGYLDANKVCIACSRCTQIMRDGGKTGCVIRDADVYLPIYKAGRASK
ncbi:oxidoreductase [Moorella sp. Hama-1]|uniref:oxidoreductase n=1 Tax=Moorella sp. Hama-1 TaxID=2138101 RepID=UPI00204B857E|nr:hypothetical protein [Moorella sp. Hama-1]BCV22301.1 oxidoreductase [Moorella sp. Hama-1]